MPDLKDQRTSVINARGVFTPLGVSRSPAAVARAVASILQDFVIIDELMQQADTAISAFTGAEAATLTHCTAASITLAVAATMTGDDPTRISQLPRTSGLPDQVLLPRSHAINYGHPIQQAIRLAGATPVLVGDETGATTQQINAACRQPGICCLLLVSSRLTTGNPVDLHAAVQAAHDNDIPVIIDGAAQDMRLAALLATGADLVLLSAQKYLAAPTAGLVIGNRHLVTATRAQDKGIGRAMKASKEAIAGTLAALQNRKTLNMATWKSAQAAKVKRFQSVMAPVMAVETFSAPDETGLLFDKVYLRIDPARAPAHDIFARLKSGNPSIWAIGDRLNEGIIGFELVQVTPDELEHLLTRLAELLG